MSSTSRVRKSSPVKQGPMRATIPMSSLLRQNTNTGFRKSPTLSPTTSWRCRTSPDNMCTSNSGQRSPGSLTYKSKNKIDALGAKGGGPGNFIRRTASLDTIYVKGQWPRDTFYFHSGLLQVDKATQTEEPSSPSPSLNEEKYFHRQRQRCSKERDRIYFNSAASTPTTSTTTTKANPVNIPIIKPMIKPPMRSSIEGLNQEIERLVLKGTSNKGLIPFLGTSNNSMEREDYELDLQLNLNLEQQTPEGHRAPLADLLRSTRSVNTQTPAQTPFETNSVNASANASACASASGSASASDSNSSSPDNDQLYYSSSRFYSTSPHINRFLAREPPDGCERVNLRFYEDTGVGTLLNPPNVTFQLKPSLGSAFQPLKSNQNENTNDSDSSNSCSNNSAQKLG